MRDGPPDFALLDALPQAVSVADGQGRFVFANAAYWARAGIPPEGCPPGTPLREAVRMLAYRGLCGPGDPEALVDAVMAVDRSVPTRRQHTTADGSRSFESASVPLPGGGFMVVSHEITAMLHAREEITARARLLESTLAGLARGVARFDSGTRLAFFNPAYEALIGLEGGTLRTGMTHREVLALLDQRGEFAVQGGPGPSAAAIARALHGPTVSQRQRPSGEVLRFDAQPRPEGGLLVEVTDITALQRAEDEARRRAAVLDGVLAALPHGVCVYGPDRRVQMFNAAYARLLDGDPARIGESVDEVVARRLASGEYDPATAAAVLARYQPGAGTQPVMRRIRPNGLVLENNLARLPDGGVVSVFTDVTALHWAEEAARTRAALLDGVLRALPHGICVYGPDMRVALFNDAYARLMPGAEVAIGEHVEEITARRLAQGELDPDYIREVRERMARGEMEREMVRVRPNGTVLAVRGALLPEGGYIAVLTDVTALHRAEAALRERAEMLDAVLEALPDGVVVYGPDRRARMSNPAYRRIMGDAAARMGELFDDVIGRRVAAGEMTPEVGKTLLSRREWSHPDAAEPHRRMRRDGTAIVTRAGRLPDGGHITVVSDVTALHRAEEELRRRATILEASFAGMRHGLAIFGPDRTLLASNDRTWDLAGIAPHPPGTPYAALVAEQIARGVLTAEQAAFASALDRSRPQRYLRRLPDGRIIELLSDPTRDGGFVMTFSDVTALHRAEAELEQRAAMQAAMLGTIRHGIILYGPDRRVQAANAKTFELTGIRPESAHPGRLMDELIDEQIADGEMTPEQGAAMKAFDRSQTVRYGRSRPDGRVLEIISEPVETGGYVITYSDVTEDRAIRAELEAAREAAEAASQAKSRFLATMSHELRTPLNAIIGLSDAIRAERDKPRADEFAALINEAGRHLLGLVDDILDVARSQTGALSVAEAPFCSIEVIRAAVEAARPAAEAARLALGVEIAPDLPLLRGDAQRLRQVLDKLLSNAVKFTPAGGRVCVTAAAEAGGVAIRVADTGIGIPPEERERMFEPFTQLDASLARRYQGSGLGLHLARTLATALGATLTLEDPQGPGLVAVLRFPPDRVLKDAHQKDC
jgi:signal transduction histidine kinase